MTEERPWRTIEDICRQLEIGRGWVEPRLRRSQYTPKEVAVPGMRAVPYYSPACQRWLARELQKLRAKPPLGHHYTVTQAAIELGCTRASVRTDVVRYRLGAVKKRRLPDNRLAESISRSAFNRLRVIRRELMAPNTMATAYELSGLTGWCSMTVSSRLRDLPSTPYLAGNGVVRDHYPIAESVQILGICQSGKLAPAGDWQTASRMCFELGRNHKWLTSRLDTFRFRQARRLLLDDRSIPRWHYPPWVLEALQVMSASSPRQSLAA